MKALTTVELNNILMKNPVTKKSFIGAFPGCVIPSIKSRFFENFVENFVKKMSRKNSKKISK